MADETEQYPGAASRIDDSLMPPIPDDRGPRRRRLFRRGAIYAFVAVAILAGTGAVWFYGSESGMFSDSGEPPLVRAAGGPIKERPAQPGGMAVPDRDKEVYSTLRDAPPPPERAETLLPPPEEPVAPPEPPAEAAVEGPAEPVPPMPESIAALPSSEPSEPMPPAQSEAMSPPPAAPEPMPSEMETAATPPASAPAEPATGNFAAATPGPETPRRITYRIQLGALRDRSVARERWGKLRSAYPDLLGDLVPHFERADLGDRGIFYRLQVGPFTAKTLAVSRCEELKKRKLGCFIVRE